MHRVLLFLLAAVLPSRHHVLSFFSGLHGKAKGVFFRLGKEPLWATPPGRMAPKERFMKGDGEILNNQIISCFEKADDVELISSKLRFLVYDRQTRINHVHVGTLMHRAAKLKINILDVLPADFLLDNLKKVTGNGTESGSIEWKPQEIAQVLYGMKTMSMRQQGVQDLALLMIERIKSCKQEFNGPAIANSLYGIQNLPTSAGSSSYNSVINRLLKSINRKIRESRAVLNSQEISNSLFGLRNMDATLIPAVLEVIESMAQRVEESSRSTVGLQFTSQGIASSFNALQGCTSDKPAALAMLRALLPHLRALPTIDQIGIGSCTMGLRSMSGETQEVRDVLEVLAEKIEGMADLKMSEHSIVSAFSGLRNFNDTLPVVRRFVGTLNDKLEQCLATETTRFSPGSIGNILHGMRKMSGEYLETRRTLALMAQALEAHGDKASPPTVPFPAIDLGKCVYGFNSMSAVADSSEMHSLLRLLAQKWDGVPAGSFTVRDLSQALFGMRGMSSNNDVPEIRYLMRVLVRHAKALSATGHSFSAQSLSMILLGVQKCSNNDPQHGQEVRDLLAALSSKHMGSVDNRCVGNCLYAMSRMTSEDGQVRSFLGSLVAQMRAARNLDYSSQELANAFYGLQNMNSEHPEVVDVLRELALGLTKLKESFTSQGMGNALTGFQTMSTVDSTVVVETLGLFADKIDSMTEPMAPLDIANAVFGLQACTAESEEVRAVLSALTVKMKEAPGTFSARDISYCLTGLSSMQQHIQLNIPEVGEMVSELNLKVSSSRLQGIPNLEFKQYGKGSKVHAV